MATHVVAAVAVLLLLVCECECKGSLPLSRWLLLLVLPLLLLLFLLLLSLSMVLHTTAAAQREGKRQQHTLPHRQQMIERFTLVHGSVESKQHPCALCSLGVCAWHRYSGCCSQGAQRLLVSRQRLSAQLCGGQSSGNIGADTGCERRTALGTMHTIVYLHAQQCNNEHMNYTQRKLCQQR